MFLSLLFPISFSQSSSIFPSRLTFGRKSGSHIEFCTGRVSFEYTFAWKRYSAVFFFRACSAKVLGNLLSSFFFFFRFLFSSSILLLHFHFAPFFCAFLLHLWRPILIDVLFWV
jgi:hypothetical protein